MRSSSAALSTAPVCLPPQQFPPTIHDPVDGRHNAFADDATNRRDSSIIQSNQRLEPLHQYAIRRVQHVRSLRSEERSRGPFFDTPAPTPPRLREANPSDRVADHRHVQRESRPRSWSSHVGTSMVIGATTPNRNDRTCRVDVVTDDQSLWALRGELGMVPDDLDSAFLQVKHYVGGAVGI
jgi:hypothetical protein